MDYTMTKAAAPSIYTFTDYREFLRRYFDYEKENNPVFSHRYFMHKAGYNSLGLYAGIVSGKSNLSHKMVPKFAKAMKLSKKQEEYLALLVHFNSAITETQKNERYAALIASIPKSIHTRLREFQKKYYKQWYNIAIREALWIIDLSDNYSDMASFVEPQITEDEVKEALHTLHHLGMIQQNSSGFWKPTDTLIVSGTEIGTDILRNYQANKIRMAEKAIFAIPKEERYISSQTWSISKEKYEKFISMIQAFQDELDFECNSDMHEDRVYQCNIQLFPLSKSKAISPTRS